MDIASFLQRVAYAGETTPGAATLRALHRAFVLAVPFENLDIHLGRRIVLDEAAFFEKIVLGHRGGFCYELNGLFGAALRELGFDVTLLSARVFDDQGEQGRELAHLLLLVRLEEPWIADTGFGDWSAEPLRLAEPGPQLVDGVSFRLTADGDRYVARRQEPGHSHWKPRYSFALTPRRLSDFAEMCDDVQTAADSVFRRHRMCTRCTPDGRVTLTEDKLIVTTSRSRRELPLDGEGAYAGALAEYFGLILPPNSAGEDQILNTGTENRFVD